MSQTSQGTVINRAGECFMQLQKFESAKLEGSPEVLNRPLENSYSINVQNREGNFKIFSKSPSAQGKFSFENF